MQALKHPSADAVTQNAHKSNTTASNTLCQTDRPRKPIYARFQGTQLKIRMIY